MTVKETALKQPDSLIGRAYRFAERAHRGQKRKSGEPYFNHVLATAENLNRWHLDEPSMVAGLLHDVVEDTPVTREELVKEFGESIAFLVDGVTKLSHIKYRGAEAKAENLRKMILAVSQDLRVLFVKLADRLHNMRTINALPPQKQKRIALETNEIYASIAGRLGMHELAAELQDLAFPILHPQESRWLTAQVTDEYEVRRRYLERFKPELEKIFAEAHLRPRTIDFRAKHYYSLYRKLLRYDMDLSRIYDLVAVRVIFDSIPDCYAALGAIHQHWPPLPGRIKDYIAMPKENNYRSLHTTIIGKEGKYIEIQLRTQEMHEENEYGIAAHWLYKEKGGVTDTKMHDALEWLRQIRLWQDQHGTHATDPQNFLDTMKIEFFRDRIFVITPKGDVFDLPAGATPIDFAYRVHSAIGDSCVGARVNEQFAPLNHELQSGDIVEILTQKNKRPSEDWLSFAKTQSARDHIKNALRAKTNRLQAQRSPRHTEFKIVAEERLGMLKDISEVIARSHVHIESAHTTNHASGRYPSVKIVCDTTDRERVEKLVLKLRKLKGIKEVHYHIS